MSRKTYDVLVVGGGITGACVAWDAALRGLSVALVERDDFGAATSANSLKTVHGGLRYLQDADLAQVRKMVRERQTFLRIAPHLVRPLPCLMPTYGRSLELLSNRGSIKHHKAVMGAALILNELLSIDRNWAMDPARQLPAGRVLSREACLSLMPGVASLTEGVASGAESGSFSEQISTISGGMLWYDAQMHNTERMLLSFLLSAAQRGAHVANYMEVVDLLREGRRVVGAEVAERLTGRRLKLRARVVVNAAGPWVDQVVGTREDDERLFNRSLAVNLVTRQIGGRGAVSANGSQTVLGMQEAPGTKVALGLNSRYVDESGEERSRVLFIAPWREYSLVGTLHLPASSKVSEALIEGFLQEVNRAAPWARLQRQDVYHVHVGYLPARGSGIEGSAAASLEKDGRDDMVMLVRKGQVRDHAREGVEGLVTAVGVKFTTARHLAERVVDLVFEKLERPVVACRTRQQRLYGGAILDWETFEQGAMERMQTEAGLSPAVAAHLVETYGSAYGEIVAYGASDGRLLEPLGPGSVVTGAEVVHAVRREMALKLSDVIYRRTELGSAGRPPAEAVERCAQIMAKEAGWSRRQRDCELSEVYENLTAEVQI